MAKNDEYIVLKRIRHNGQVIEPAPGNSEQLVKVALDSAEAKPLLAVDAIKPVKQAASKK